jgi:hypothetical protein
MSYPLNNYSCQPLVMSRQNSNHNGINHAHPTSPSISNTPSPPSGHPVFREHALPTHNSHRNPTASHALFPIVPLSAAQDVMVRRQQVHSWPLDTRLSLVTQQQQQQHSTLPISPLSPFPGGYQNSQRIPQPHSPTHSHSHSQPATINRGSLPPWTLAGSLDPTTGIFYRTPENPRLRTAQACEKCRTRKAKVLIFQHASQIFVDSTFVSLPYSRRYRYSVVASIPRATDVLRGA